MHLNVRSIPKNIDKLNNYLLSFDTVFGNWSNRNVA